MCNKITITVEAHDEDYAPEVAETQQRYAAGFADGVRETCKKAIGKWGWCYVAVTASMGKGDQKKRATKYLGQCSYLGPYDFMACEYFSDMVKEAVSELTTESMG